MPDEQGGIRWFVTAAAVEDYMEICGENIDDAPAFHRAAGRLRNLCRLSKFKREYAGGRFESWQVNDRYTGRKIRLNLSVSLSQRAEGHADQLVSVQNNDDRKTHKEHQ